MNSNLIDLLQCPSDGCFAPLRLQSSQCWGQIAEGVLECTNCGQRNPIASGIPSFLGGLQVSHGKQKAEIESRNKSFERVQYIPDRRRPAIDAFQAAMPYTSGFSLLDCGCGNGQVTAAWSRAGRVVGLDFSPTGLTHFLVPRQLPPFDLVHADATCLPFRPCSFDVAIASVLIHHLPTPELREASVRELHRTLKPGGRLVVSVYNWNHYRRRANEPQEGSFDQAVFYHRYTTPELGALLGKYLAVERIMGVYANLPGTYRALQASGMHVSWDRLWRNTAIARRYSHLLVAVCRRKSTAY